MAEHGFLVEAVCVRVRPWNRQLGRGRGLMLLRQWDTPRMRDAWKGLTSLAHKRGAWDSQELKRDDPHQPCSLIALPPSLLHMHVSAS